MTISTEENKQKTKPVILVVDDQPQGIELLEAYLVPLGYEIVKATNGEEALGKLSSNQIDLILLDVIMPGMDGFEVTRRIRQDKKNHLMPIILVTVLKETEDRVKGIEAGCDDFISKPIDRMELFARIRSLLRVKDYNDLMSTYMKELESEVNRRKELESEVNRRTEELKTTLENLKQEITEHKRVEDTLKLSEQNFRNSIDSSSIGIRIGDVERQTFYANQAFLDIFGYENIDEVRANPVEEHYIPESYADYVLRKDKLLRGEPIPDNVEVDIIRKDSAVRHLQVSNRQVFWNGKQQFQLLYNDITDRVEAEKALKLSEQNFRNSLDSSPMGIFLGDAEGHVRYMNQAFLQMFDYDNIDEVKISSPTSRYTQESYTGHLLRLERTSLGKSNPDNFEIDVVHKDGTIRHLQVFRKEVFWNGKQQPQLLYNDVTALKQAEKEKQLLEEKAQVASRLAAIGGMAAGIAHEINNPLTGVLGFSQMLLAKHDVPEEIKKELKWIADGSQRVADIVKRLLTFARQTKPNRQLTNLNELIENTLKLREYVLKTANIEVVTRLDPELPLSLVDPGQLQQVFLNLIVNAEQAMKEAHGRGNLIITTEKKDNNIRITFQDDGPGITRENMRHLFEPFFTTKDVGEGTGLGLSLSRSIVLEHNGKINVVSEFGHGATFIVELPIIEALPSEIKTVSPTVKVEKLITKKDRILVIDDEPIVRALIEKVLTQSGHSVDTIDDAIKAIDKLDAGVIYDVILIDVRMPGMSGIELYSRILEKTPKMKNRIIFITGDVMGIDTKAFLTQNNLTYFAKPFNIEALKEKINAIVMSNAPESDSTETSGR